MIAKYDYDGNGKEVWTAPTWLWVLGNNIFHLFRAATVISIFLWLYLGGVGTLTKGFVKGLRGTNARDIEKTVNQPHQLPIKSGVPVDRVGSDTESEAIIRELMGVVQKNDQLAFQNSGITGFTKNHVGFSSGDIIRVGQPIRSGAYAGKKIVRVDFDNQRVLITGGIWLRLHSNQNEERKPTEDVSAVLQRATKLLSTGTTKEKPLKSILVDKRVEHAATASSDSSDQANGTSIR